MSSRQGLSVSYILHLASHYTAFSSGPLQDSPAACHPFLHTHTEPLLPYEHLPPLLVAQRFAEPTSAHVTVLAMLVHPR